MNLSLEVKMVNGIMYVWTKWSAPPRINDSALCNYELRLKSAEGKEWEVRNLRSFASEVSKEKRKRKSAVLINLINK